MGNLQYRPKVVQVTARCTQRAQEVVNVAVVTADPNIQEQGEAKLAMLGVPAFGLEISKAGDPAIVGGKVTYKITVTNTGTLPTNQITITATIPKDKLTVTSTEGPTRARVVGDTVTFPAVDALQAKQMLTYTIETQAAQAGNARVRVELGSTSLTTPVVKE